MYSILIKDTKNAGLYRFLTVKQEIMEEKTTTVTDEDTHEVKQETTYVGTGEYETVRFETEEKDELEEKCIELLRSYKVTDFLPVDTLDYTTDLIWNNETDKENV